MTSRLLRSICGLVLGLWLAGCAATRNPAPEAGPAGTPPPDGAFRVFLLGNTGAGDPAPVLAALRRRLDAAGSRSAVVFLGDYLTAALPDSADSARPVANARLAPVVRALAGYGGRVVLVPGDADRRHSLAALERHFEGVFCRGNVFVPDRGAPGPVEIELTDRLTLLALDTGWWLDAAHRPADPSDPDPAGDFLLDLDDAVRRNRKRDLLVVGHHPLRSNGAHAGYLPPRAHLFPLTDLDRRAWLPLPLVGSAYPLYRRFIGGRQDLARAPYRSLRLALETVFRPHERLVYAAAHERNLQHFPLGASGHSLVSGGAAHADPLAPGHGAAFTAAETGFLTLEYWPDRQVWLEAVTADGRTLHRERLFDAAPDAAAPVLVDAAVAPVLAEPTHVVVPNPRYAAGPLRALVFGRQHRAAWTTAVRLPVLDLGREAGGLVPVRRGGGMQTLSLRLRGTDGRQYVLRSVDKDPSGTVPLALRGTLVSDVVQDQISALHPFGALLVPPLADAAGVYHTNPRLVYVPRHPRLGPYADAFGGRFLLFEEFPDDDASDLPQFGRSRKVVGVDDLYDRLADNDHRVDARAFARARLFDMFLSDWDRHRDQWRWAAFDAPGGKGRLYRPIPRDRDWAFNRMNGLVPSLASLLIPKFQDFTADYGFLPGLTFNGLEQDRRFTAALDRAAWIEIADSLRAALTDSVLDAALLRLPPEIRPLYEADYRALLRRRRDRLPQVAAAYYRLMARVVDVVGSDRHERFEVHRLDPDRTEVVVYKITKDGRAERELLRRTFRRDETREIRLYGLDGRDRFVFTGHAARGITVRAVGGPGEDTFDDRSRVDGPSRRTRLYDTPAGTVWHAGPETAVFTSADPAINAYDSRAYRHDRTFPLSFFGRNADDGLYLGGGARFVRHGFRKAPFAAAQKVMANYAARTRSFNAVYEGHFTEVVGAWDVALDARLLAPNSVRNFYGLGNETRNTLGDATYYQARLTQLTVAPALVRRVAEGAAFRVGPTLGLTRVEADPDGFVGHPQAGLSGGAFRDQWLAGLQAALTLESADPPAIPRQGFRWTTSAAFNYGLRNTASAYGTLGSSLTVYYAPPAAPPLTFAARVGGATHIGRFPFYRANTLGGHENLRGYRGTRFAGRTSIFQNLEVRARVCYFSTYVAAGQAGVLAFLDNGRVWTDGESSRVWHQGYGGGLWAAFFDQVVVSATLGLSHEDESFTLKLGYLY